MPGRYDFLIETYRTERIKTLGVWAQVPLDRMAHRPAPRARTPLEHMVHQCVSEGTWMQNMLGIVVSRDALPAVETKHAFLEHYAAVSGERLAAKEDDWFEGQTTFFDTTRSRAWVLTRRFAHSAHHRGQLTTYLRVWGLELYSTYGPTAETGGLFQNGARVIYRAESIEALLEQDVRGESGPPLPGPGSKSPTERP